MLGQRLQNTSIKRLALEAVFLVIAVLFALAADEAWEDYENSEAANLALSRILLELEGNENLISEAWSLLVQVQRFNFNQHFRGCLIYTR